MTTERQQYGLIAGSGFEVQGEAPSGEHSKTRFGLSSSPVRLQTMSGWPVHVILRHGQPHTIPPHAINYRANLEAFRMLGVKRVIALNTVGVIRPSVAAGDLAVPDQLIDYTWGRVHSIYHEPCATLDHVDMTRPLSDSLRAPLLAAAAATGVTCHDGGVYAVTQGPRLETAAEVDRLQRDGVDYVGMTLMPEAAIAREMGMDYACLSLVVNYAAGRGDKAIHEDIDECTTTARTRAMRVLDAYFEALPG